MITDGQRGCMEDQCCSLDPSKSAPCTPKYTERKPVASMLNMAENSVMLAILIDNLHLLKCTFLYHFEPDCSHFIRVNYS